ncbi:MAG: PASTA domain-containing protein [Oscillospiraceae bacterium]|nr:PASTA domain-containing protein [Oscillospiraceae bacterium]
MAENKLCMGCMEYKGAARVCPKCGYVENTPHNPAYIAPGTILHERYLVGQQLDSNGQGASYIAYDTAVSCKVLLNEYMPEGLCVRVKGKPTISVNYNNLAQYKAMMAEYTELNKSLAKMRSLSSHLTPTLDIFAENNTTYSVYEYIEGVRLVDYLKENAGELSWSEVSAMFPPLFTTLSLVHNAGVIHRGISPETIYVTEKGELKLTDFCISGLRTKSTELVTEIYQGYAAPEQYSAASRQGTWTDVYGICAVLYRILTGSKPDPANIRLERDNLYTPQELNSNIPKHVSDVIMEGMNLIGEDRIQTITELVTRLFDQPAAGFSKTQTLEISRSGIMESSQAYMNGNQYPDNEYYNNGYNNGYADPYGNGYDNGYNDGYNSYNDYGNYDNYDDYDDSGIESDEEEISAFDRIKVPLIIGILLVAIVIVIIVILVQLFNGGEEMTHIRDSSSVSESVSSEAEETEETTEETEETEETEMKNKMPSLIGKKLDDIKSKFEEKYGVTIESSYEENEEYPKDVIFWQDIEIGQHIEEGMTIKVKVSEGRPPVSVPEFENWPLADFTALCDSMGIKYTTVSAIDLTKVNGIVIGVAPAPGEQIDTETEFITITYVDNPEETTVEETVPPEVVEPPVEEVPPVEEPTEAPPVEEVPDAPVAEEIPVE